MSPAKKKNSSPEGVLACDNDLTFTFVTTGCLPTAVVHMHTRGRIHAHTHTKTTKTAATRWRHHQGWCTHPRVIRLHRLTPLPPCTTGQSLAFIKRSIVFYGVLYCIPTLALTQAPLADFLSPRDLEPGGASSFPLYSLMFTPKTPSGDPIPYCDYR